MMNFLCSYQSHENEIIIPRDTGTSNGFRPHSQTHKQGGQDEEDDAEGDHLPLSVAHSEVLKALQQKLAYRRIEQVANAERDNDRGAAALVKRRKASWGFTSKLDS